ncbi:hypothetical protein [Natrarchaeobius chitinivorans]|uniref:Uncharacterized protein n=1 Tax=Natrarchaeobius chitinivorans TaxID=1679083 RepID=A0A3N6MHJ2_NATCH|nr:hypothetical protein [Natrarchaeobius chitinivorans]RQG95081.1 hypothetical protein EA473_08995 [Natrarchaeobius chitinivorans]
MPGGESDRTIAECLDCGNVYAVKEWPDGTIQPIGMRNGCQCGAAELQVIQKTNITNLRED